MTSGGDRAPAFLPVSPTLLSSIAAAGQPGPGWPTQARLSPQLVRVHHDLKRCSIQPPGRSASLKARKIRGSSTIRTVLIFVYIIRTHLMKYRVSAIVFARPLCVSAWSRARSTSTAPPCDHPCSWLGHHARPASPAAHAFLSTVPFFF